MNIEQKTHYVEAHSGAIPYLNLRYDENDDAVLTFLDGWLVESQRWDEYEAEIEAQRRN